MSIRENTRRRLFVAVLVFGVTLTLRLRGEMPPFDDAYHLKRMEYSAAHFPSVLDYDRDRGENGAFCPWPPFYDLFGAAVLRVFGGVMWLPPIAFAGFASLVAVALSRYGPLPALTGGLTLAFSPYLIGISSRGHIDHHLFEPLLLLAIVATTHSCRDPSPRERGEGRRGRDEGLGMDAGGTPHPRFADPLPAAAGRGISAERVFRTPMVLRVIATLMTALSGGIALAAAITVALLVQPALIVAAGVAFIVLVIRGEEAKGVVAFGVAAVAIALFRLTRPDGYPTSPWFLGYPHVAVLAGAAMTCVLSWMLRHSIGGLQKAGALHDASRIALAFAAGIATTLCFPSALEGLAFFHGDPWLRTIVEFQPMFLEPSRWGTDLANLTAGAVLAFTLPRKHRAITIFAVAYLLLALLSRRFLVPAIPIFAVAGALAVGNIISEREHSTTTSSSVIGHRAWSPIALALAAFMIAPLVVYDAYATRLPDQRHDEVRAIASALLPLPRGRVLAQWSLGHAIDVIGDKPVIIDNFGSMPGDMEFENATDALLTTRPDVLLRYCRSRSVRYLVLTDPSTGILISAASVGIDPRLYARTPLALRTVWSRLWRGEALPGYTRIATRSAAVWQID